ncbi:hypothetical protein [Sphingomonas sp. RS2018]
MNTPVRLADLIDADTMAMVSRLAAERGTTSAAYVVEAVQRLADEDAALMASLEEADRQIDRGEFYTQEDVERWLAGLAAAA